MTPLGKFLPIVGQPDPAQPANDLGEGQHAGAGDVDDAGPGGHGREPQRLDRVRLVQHLQARIEAADTRRELSKTS